MDIRVGKEGGESNEKTAGKMELTYNHSASSLLLHMESSHDE